MSTVPRGLQARRFVRALETDGFVLQRVRGSHRIYRHADGKRVVVAYHSLSDTFPIGTLRAMIDAAGWQEEEDLRRLGLTEQACPLLKKYVAAGWLGRKSGRGFYSFTS